MIMIIRKSSFEEKSPKDNTNVASHSARPEIQHDASDKVASSQCTADGALANVMTSTVSTSTSNVQAVGQTKTTEDQPVVVTDGNLVTSSHRTEELISDETPPKEKCNDTISSTDSIANSLSSGSKQDGHEFKEADLPEVLASSNPENNKDTSTPIVVSATVQSPPFVTISTASVITDKTVERDPMDTRNDTAHAVVVQALVEPESEPVTRSDTATQRKKLKTKENASMKALLKKLGFPSWKSRCRWSDDYRESAENCYFAYLEYKASGSKEVFDITSFRPVSLEPTQKEAPVVTSKGRVVQSSAKKAQAVE